jgi:hypothetical protein
MIQYLAGNRSKYIYHHSFNLCIYRIYADTKFNPSSSLLHGLNQSTTINSVPTGSQSETAVRYSEYDTNAHHPPRPASSTRPTVANSIIKSSTAQWPPSSSSYYEYDNRDNPYTLQTSSSIGFVDDVQRMVSRYKDIKITKYLFQNKNLQRMSTSDTGLRRPNSERYV